VHKSCCNSNDCCCPLDNCCRHQTSGDHVFSEFRCWCRQHAVGVCTLTFPMIYAPQKTTPGNMQQQQPLQQLQHLTFAGFTQEKQTVAVVAGFPDLLFHSVCGQCISNCDRGPKKGSLMFLL